MAAIRIATDLLDEPGADGRVLDHTLAPVPAAAVTLVEAPRSR